MNILQSEYKLTPGVKNTRLAYSLSFAKMSVYFCLEYSWKGYEACACEAWLLSRERSYGLALDYLSGGERKVFILATPEIFFPYLIGSCERKMKAKRVYGRSIPGSFVVHKTREVLEKSLIPRFLLPCKAEVYE